MWLTENRCEKWKVELGTLSLFKARGVITGKSLFLKYQKQTITAALNGKGALMMLSTRYLYVFYTLIYKQRFFSTQP